MGMLVVNKNFSFSRFGIHQLTALYEEPNL